MVCQWVVKVPGLRKFLGPHGESDAVHFAEGMEDCFGMFLAKFLRSFLGEHPRETLGESLF